MKKEQLKTEETYVENMEYQLSPKLSHFLRKKFKSVMNKVSRAVKLGSVQTFSQANEIPNTLDETKSPNDKNVTKH